MIHFTHSSATPGSAEDAAEPYYLHCERSGAEGKRQDAHTSSLAEMCEAKLFAQLADLASEKNGPTFVVGANVPLNRLEDNDTHEPDKTVTSDGILSCETLDTKNVQVPLTRSRLVVPAASETMNVPSGKSETEENQASVDHEVRCDPITIRWDSPSGGSGKLSLPCTDADKPHLEQLLRDCENSFDQRGESDTDETHKQFGKLDEKVFSCNFNPYSLGIMDAAALALIPELAKCTERSCGLRAELRGLNVCSGPSRTFNADTDALRRNRSVGSLVICLPSLHEGGQMIVHNQGRKQIFDWSSQKGKETIQWAAFLNDCKCEVLGITSGYRVTLTYNLFSTCDTNAAPLDLQHTDLYRTLQKLLSKPGFCKEGKMIGYRCVHQYPHTHEAMFDTFPAILKGTDKLFFESLSQLGLQVKLRQELIGRMFGIYGPGFSSRNLPDYNPASYGTSAMLSNGLRPMYLNRKAKYCEYTDDLVVEWDMDHTVQKVVWLNCTRSNQLAMVYGRFDEEYDIVAEYANLVITATVPPFYER